MENRIRHICFLFSILASFFIFYSPITRLIAFSFHDTLYSHIPLIPFLSGFFLFTRRRPVFSQIEYSFGPGMAFIAAACLLYTAGLLRSTSLSNNDYFSLSTSAALAFWIGIFILFYGFRTFKSAAFPLLLLFCMVPLPGFLVQASEHLLQRGSAETVHGIFYLLGLEMTRDGFVFHFPQLSIEILESCTGMRSSIALVITSIVAANLLLNKGWARTLLVLWSVPITILKNSVRIAVLSVVGVYMDQSVFDSQLHNIAGGILFFGFALFLLWVAIRILARIEGGGLTSKKR